MQPESERSGQIDGMVDLLGTLTDDFDLDEFFQRVFEHARRRLPVSAVALVLGNTAGRPGVVPIDHASDVLEGLQLDSDEGPCLDCLRTGKPVVTDDLADGDVRWRPWSDQALARGYRSAYSTPLLDRSGPIGAFNLFCDRTHALDATDLTLAQALAHLMTIAIGAHRSGKLVDQLQTALDSRVVIEQAKGALAGHRDLDVDTAFELMRRLARRTNTKLTTVAERVIDGSVDADTLMRAFDAAPRRRGPAPRPGARGAADSAR